MRSPGLSHRAALIALSLSLLSRLAFAAAPPALQPPDEKMLVLISEKTTQLEAGLASLRADKTPDWKLADIEVFDKAAVWATRHGEWYADNAKRTVTLLDRGLERAGQLKAGQSPWLDRQGTVFRGYRSAIDGSIQPYKVILPRDYPGKDKHWRLDVLLHGRDAVISEVKFLGAGDSTNPPPEQDFVELHVFGRGNNAFRWSGERDVFEAIDAFRAGERTARGRETIDSDRIVLRGFSMGGAGAWHLGLHYPSYWCSVSPGAGFTTTYGREKNPDGKLPDYVVKCLGIYDALDYAENVFDVPVVAYGGEIDPQREASESIKAKITPLGLHATFLVGPKMGHKYDPESLKQIMKMQGEDAAKGRPSYPGRIRFVTMTPKFGACYWTDVLRQEHQYERSMIDARRDEAGLVIKTENVRTLALTLPEEKSTFTVDIDGRKVVVTGGDTVLLDKQDGAWSQIDSAKWREQADAGAWKSPTLSGPIDDAFVSPFLCVRGTGKAWNADVQRQADAELDRFTREWDKWLRGTALVKNDTDVTVEDIANKNLILFGDPSSNALIGRVLPKLPIHWTAEELNIGGKTYPASSHLPALIYPSPLAPNHYIVLNSGHTFHEAEFKDTNRMLYPHLGDWAVLEVTPGANDAASAQLVTAGLFDEQWHWPNR